MNIFNIISLLGGLALFLYGMKLMGNSLKEGSSGTLKVIMEKVTNNPVKAFFLGVIVTAVIQSSTATIVITSGLVAGGIISLRQSLGIIIGANVGTTVTGQIIRLLDVNAEGTSFLKFFTPSTLAPLALIIGIMLIMFLKSSKSSNIGNVCMGFGILFTGLMNMTAAVSTLTEGGLIERIFSSLGDNPFLGYLIGYVRALATNPNMKLGFHQTWAYAKDSTHGGFVHYGRDQMVMYTAIVDAVGKAVAAHAELSFVVPSGTAIQNARTTALGDNLTRDGYHLDYGVGRYIAACTWLEAVTGKTAVGRKFRPQGTDEKRAALCQQAAHDAMVSLGETLSPSLY